MKEILYIQAGNRSNWIGSHFWNTQESYFTYEEGEDPLTNHDISFREGQTLKGTPTFCPRLLLFDRKANFGIVPDNLYGEDVVVEAEEVVSQWQTFPRNGEVVEYRQQRISKSRYQEKLDAGEEDEDAAEAKVTGHTTTDMRFWSDYSRVFYHPRSLQRLPDLADYDDVEGDWMSSQEAFAKHDEDHDFLEGDFRFFVEECDHLQGIQLTNDTGTFGGFTHSLLTSIRDEVPKLPTLTFSLLSSITPRSANADESLNIARIINDAFFLRSMNELSTLTIPLQSPPTWKTGEWLDSLALNRESLYHTSALYSTHIENVTLPVRLKSTHDDLTSLTSLLTWNTSTRFAHLNGVLPLSPSQSTTTFERDVEKRLYDYSSLDSVSHDTKKVWSQLDVTRGLTYDGLIAYQNWNDKRDMQPYSIHAPATPLPSSFPTILPSPSPTRPTSIPSLTTLSSTPRTSTLFSSYASSLDSALKRHTDVLERMRLEVDDVREVRDALWVIEDAFRADEGWVDSVEDLEGDDVEED
ncbi:tubulin nucleotide-binding domain-like protein [Panus rudis PR-1116 ss-1]|nr:tubulin nucleotide-binding domain-like protein [Panus rudis PR-1116 ss-1]